ncbi:MAG: FHA domain-containing protein [Pseudoxanthomonas sp.]
MLGSRRVQPPHLHIPLGRPVDHPLDAGVHRVVRGADGQVGIDRGQPGRLLAQFCLDQRGLWLQVPAGLRGLHVNGRPVRRMAMLRAGDSVHADGVEMRVLAMPRPVPARLREQASADPRLLLRGIGGAGHGRALALRDGVLVGADADADIVLEGVQAAAHHARLAWTAQGVWLRHADPQATSRVNGVPVHEALLVRGDMVEFEPQSRWCVETPCSAQEGAEPVPAAAAPAAAPGRRSWERWPWLLVSALLLSALLSALLLFGAG